MDMFKKSNYQNLDQENNSSTCSRVSVSIVAILGITAVIVAMLTIFPRHETVLPGDITQVKSTNNSTITLRIQDGKLKGKILRSRAGREYLAFYNIPYAKPPVDDLRFEPPQEYKEGWRGTRNATQPGERCLQKKVGSDEIRGSEDCLYLTVYSPILPGRQSIMPRSKNQLPVMVYIYGGAFIGGCSSVYGGDYFMDTDTVLVLPEYRVGTLGNLNTEDRIIPGNMGFKDQVMALRWVQKNIHKFGGNPKKVTLFGNSSGAMVVHAHIFSTMSSGLFHRAISQSGTALGLEAIDRYPRERAERIGQDIGCLNVNVTQDLVNCLKKSNASDILLAQMDTDLTGLTVEIIPDSGDLSNVFLSDTPLNLLQDGKIVSDVPWILGVNSAELAVVASVLTNANVTQFLNDNWEEAGPAILQLDAISEGTDDNRGVAEQVRQFYFGDKKFSIKTRWEFMNMVSDRVWVHPTYTTATLYAQKSQSPVYLYWLTHESRKSNLAEIADPSGVSHAKEVQYLFPFSKFPYISLDSKDANFSVIMVDAWASFARGDTPLFMRNGEEWTPINQGSNRNNFQWLQLHEQPHMVEVFQDRMKFWDSFNLSYLYLGNITYG